MLNQILDRLDAHSVRTELSQGGRDIYAAVLIPIVNDPDEPSIVLTKRSENLSSHSGQVAFPGGKWEENDKHLLETALRETHEEINLHPDDVTVIAELPPHSTLQQTFVLPYVGLVPPGLEYVANQGELDAVFTVPISYLLNAGNLTTFTFKDDNGGREMPCYYYEGFVIWGFTLSILAGFLNFTLDAGLELFYPSDVIRQHGVRAAYQIAR